MYKNSEARNNSNLFEELQGYTWGYSMCVKGKITYNKKRLLFLMFWYLFWLQGKKQTIGILNVDL